jgi:hypothetical protein
MDMKITQRDKRTLMLTGIAAVAIIFWFVVVDGFLSDWKEVRSDLSIRRSKFESIASSEGLSAADKGLFSIVPVFASPGPEDTQGPAYMKKFNEQLKKLGIKAELKYLKSLKSKSASGYKTLRLQSQGRCKYTQAIDLMGKLYENPLFVSIEQLTITPDPKKLGEVEFTLVTSTFAK